MSIIQYILWPFGQLMRLFYEWTGSYAIALLLFAVVIKIVLLPFGIKQQKNAIKQAKLRPKEMAIRKKYAGRDDKPTQNKMQQEIMELYQKEGFNPMGGCLPLLLQMPIIVILYRIVYMPLTYICQWSAERISALQATAEAAGLLGEGGKWTAQAEIQLLSMIKSNPASFDAEAVQSLPQLHLFGIEALDLSASPSLTNLSWLVAIPVLVFLTTFLSMKLTRRFTYQSPDQAAQQNTLSMKIMDFAMPLFSLWISFSLPAALGLYWIYQSILSFGQQYLLFKLMPMPQFTEEDYRRAEKEMGVKGKGAKKAADAIPGAVRSLHHIDDEDYLPPVNKEQARWEAAAEEEAQKARDAKKQASDTSEGTLVEKKIPDASPISKAPLKDEQDRSNK